MCEPDHEFLIAPFSNASFYLHGAIIHHYVYDIYTRYFGLVIFSIGGEKTGQLSSYEKILPALHQISNMKQFDALMEENPTLNDTSLLEIYLSILHEYSRQCNDYSFIVRGVISKLRAAISFVSILKKFAILYRTLNKSYAAMKSFWTTEFLQFTISKIYQWDTLLSDIEPTKEAMQDSEFFKLRERLSFEIVYSFRYVLESKLLYGGEMPKEVTNWVVNLVKRGYKMSSTPIYQYDTLVSHVLAEAYR